MPAKWVIVAGLGFGDEGKGTTIDWLCNIKQPNLVVRYNGGPQAMHHVVFPNGAVHAFRSFGSGTLHNVPTLLSRGMAVCPRKIMQEVTLLKNFMYTDPRSLLFVSKEASLLLPIHGEVIRALESMRPGGTKHGTTGVGVGAIQSYCQDTGLEPILVKDIYGGDFKDKLVALREWAIDKVGTLAWKPEGTGSLEAWVDNTYSEAKADLDQMKLITGDVEKLLLQEDLIYWEGAQGVLLDEWHGFYPHTTWSDTTFEAAKEVAADVGVEDNHIAYKLGVIRSYHTRHGAGPLPSQRDYDYIPEWRQEKHNEANMWMGPFRIGEFEVPLYNYARKVSIPHGVMMTHLDHAEDVQVVSQYSADNINFSHLEVNPNPGDNDYMEHVGNTLKKAIPIKAGISMMDYLEMHGFQNLGLAAGSYGPTWADKQFLGSSLADFLGV